MRYRLSILFLVVLQVLRTECDGDSTGQENSGVTDGICQTDDCKKIGTKLKNSMQNTTEPCDDFYEYVCGNWSTLNPIPSYRDSWSERIKLIYKTAEHLRDILEEATRPDDIEPVKMAKAWYRACMDLDAIEEAGLKPLTSVLNGTGGWPVAMNNWTGLPRNLTWQSLHNTYRRLYDVNVLYHVYLKPDSVNASQLMIAVDQRVSYPLFNAMHSTGRDNSFVMVYIRTIKNIVKAFANDSGASVNETKLFGEVIDIILLTLSLQKIAYGTPTEVYETMTISELQAFYDSANSTDKSAIDWLATIKYVLQDSPQEINGNTNVEVKNKADLHLFRALIDITPVERIVNYIQWGFVSMYMRHTNKAMRDLFEDTSKTISARDEPEPRWVTCITDLQLKDALSYEYVKRYRSQSAISNVTEMVDEVNKEMKEHVQNTNWLTDEDKQFINGKLDNIRKFIGYAKLYENVSAIIDRYKGLTIGPNYFENYVTYEQFETKVIAQGVNKPFDKHGWLQQPTIVNAFYYSQANSILIPLAEFQDMSFALTIPPSVKFGSTGFMVGHELSHVFLSPGTGYDKNGNQIASGEELVGGEYDNKVNCYVKKYNQYVAVPSSTPNETIYVNGNKTMVENIADNVGLQVSFDAYRKHVARSSSPPLKLPGLETIADEKLFFMIFAADKCEAVRPKHLKFRYAISEHAPWKQRVNGVLKNTKAFASTFNCPENSPMNPTDKCSLI